MNDITRTSNTVSMSPELANKAHTLMCEVVGAWNTGGIVTHEVRGAVRQWLIDVADYEQRTSHEPPELRAIAERIRDHACAYGAPADSLLVKRELIGQLAQILRGSISEPPPATHMQWQRDRLANYLVKNKPELPDHACPECAPGGDIVVEDFQCCYHMALKIIGTPEPSNRQYLDATGEPCALHRYIPHVLPGAPKDRCHECGLCEQHPIHAVTKGEG